MKYQTRNVNNDFRLRYIQNYGEQLKLGVFAQRNVRELYIASQSVLFIDVLTLNNFQFLVKLEIRTERVEILNKKTFEKMTRLQILHVYMKFHSIHQDTFDNLINLEEIILVSENLIDLPKTLFYSNKRLKYVEIHSKSNTQDKLCKNLSKLQVLKLHNSFNKNYLHNINFENFKKNNNLKCLVISNFDLSTMDYNILKNFHHIIYLKIQSSLLNDLANFALKTIFKKMQSLRYFNVSNNTIRYFWKISKKCITLRTLILDSNMFCSTSSFEFRTKNESIETISLAKNKITVIDNNFFINLIRLRFINLSRNEIKGIQNNLFANANNLEVLKLSGNQMRSIEPNAFNGLDKLKILQLDNNKIMKLSKNCFGSLVRLIILNLSCNYITTIPKNLFQTNQLLKLFLHRNYIKTIEESAFESLNYLEYLYLQHNQLTYLNDDMIRNQKLLKNLNLSRNRIQNLPLKFFSFQKELINLNLRENEISILDQDTFDDLINLKYLNLGNNQIKTIPKSFFTKNTKLQLLLLNNNTLKSLPDFFFFNTFAKIINLTNNPFEELTKKVFKFEFGSVEGACFIDVNFFNKFLLVRFKQHDFPDKQLFLEYFKFN